MDVFDWTRELAEKLKIEFGERVAFIGLQGSDVDPSELVDLLLRWAENVICSATNSKQGV